MLLRPFRIVLLLVCLAACAGGDDAEEQSASVELEGIVADQSGGFAGAAPQAAPMPPPPAADAVGLDVGRIASKSMTPQEAAPPQVVGADSDSGVPSMIIRTGEARLQVDSLEASIQAVERTAAGLGGWVAHSSSSLGERDYRQARLEVKIPAARWEDLLAGLERVGELEQLSTATEDVGEQFVDLTAQLANGRRLEDRYLELLANRTGSLEDLLAVERELARVRERIEMLQGRLRYLSQRVSVSTLVVNLYEPMDLLGVGPDEQPIRDAFRAAWRNFLGVITGGIALLGGALPLVILGALLVWGWRRRSLRRGAAARDD